MNDVCPPGDPGPESAVLAAMCEILERARGEHDWSAPAERADAVHWPPAAQDAREDLADGGPCLLVIEDDPGFAGAVLAQCRARGLACLVACSGWEGLRLAWRYRPLGIFLELKLAGSDSWRVLDALESDDEMRDLPVLVMSVRVPAPALGANGADRRWGRLAADDLDRALRTVDELSDESVRRLLIVENDAERARWLERLLDESGLCFDVARGSREAVQAVVRERRDCAILDLDLWDLGRDQLLRTLMRDGLDRPAVLLCTARAER